VAPSSRPARHPSSILEWRLHPARLDDEAVAFAEVAWQDDASQLRHA
jgi:hypothetical protein